MIKRTLHFGNPVYLSTRDEQLVVQYPDDHQSDKTVPIEDVGLVVLEHRQITITNALLEKLLLQQAAVVTCNQSHLPVSYLLPLQGHSEHQERFRTQIAATEPLKKNLWQQTITSKIQNQASHLRERGISTEKMDYWAQHVTSGDTQNHESRAAVYYWQHVFDLKGFNRQPGGAPPNHLLNYGYAILRAICARSLVSSGLLPVMGIHHRNKYNSYCLADDIMEPYRPWVDLVVAHLVDNLDNLTELTTDIKKELLQIPALDVTIEGNKSPLMVAMSRTTSSLYDCFAGQRRKIIFPEF